MGEKKKIPPCFALFCTCCGLEENGRRMSGCRESACLVWGHVMGNMLVPFGTYSYPGILHTHIHTCTNTLHVRSSYSHTAHGQGGVGGWKVKHFSNGTGSVGTVDATQHATASNMWTGLTGSCCERAGALQAERHSWSWALIYCSGMIFLSGLVFFFNKSL